LLKEFEFNNLNLELKEENQQQHFTTLGDGCGERHGKSNDIMRQHKHQHGGK